MLDNHSACLTDFGFLHFEPQVGAFTSSLTNSSEHGISTVRTGNTSDQFGQNNRLAQTSTTEQTRLTTTNKWRQQIHNFNTGFENFGVGRKLIYLRSSAVNWPMIFSFDVTSLINRFAQDVKNTSESCFTNRNSNGLPGVDAVQSTLQAFRATQSNATNASATKVLLNLTCQIDIDALLLGNNLDRVIDWRKGIFSEFGIKSRANHLSDSSHILVCCSRHLTRPQWINT